MVVLGIETSGLAGSVALVRDGVCVEESSLDQAGRRHAQSLALQLRELLKRHQIAITQVDAVAVSHGPGSFTGLRVGMVCAKTFAYATGCKFVAVDTFTAVAMNCPADVETVCVVEDAQRGELFVGSYQRTGDDWIRALPIQLVDAEEWLKSRTANEFVVGRGLARCDLSITAARCFSEPKFSQPQAASVALKGLQMLQHPESVDPTAFDCWKAVPFYIRRSAAEEQRDQRESAGING